MSSDFNGKLCRRILVIVTARLIVDETDETIGKRESGVQNPEKYYKPRLSGIQRVSTIQLPHLVRYMKYDEKSCKFEVCLYDKKSDEFSDEKKRALTTLSSPFQLN